MNMTIEARASIEDHARHVTMFESEEIKKMIIAVMRRGKY